MSSRMALQSLHVQCFIVANRYVFTCFVLHSSKFRMHKSQQICPVYPFVVLLHFWHLLAVCCVVKNYTRRYPYIRSTSRQISAFEPARTLENTVCLGGLLQLWHLETCKSGEANVQSNIEHHRVKDRMANGPMRDQNPWMRDQNPVSQLARPLAFNNMCIHLRTCPLIRSVWVSSIWQSMFIWGLRVLGFRYKDMQHVLHIRHTSTHYFVTYTWWGGFKTKSHDACLVTLKKWSNCLNMPVNLVPHLPD